MRTCLMWTHSLPQYDPALWQPHVSGPEAKPLDEQSDAEKAQTDAYVSSRSAEDVEAFQFGLKQTMDLWYAWP